jgi:hypothetical protein
MELVVIFLENAFPTKITDEQLVDPKIIGRGII